MEIVKTETDYFMWAVEISLRFLPVDLLVDMHLSEVIQTGILILLVALEVDQIISQVPSSQYTQFLFIKTFIFKYFIFTLYIFQQNFQSSVSKYKTNLEDFIGEQISKRKEVFIF